MDHSCEFARPALTVDIVVFALGEQDLRIMLIQRDLKPYEGHWALPGGFVRVEETLEEAARTLPPLPCVWISALYEQGIYRLKEAILSKLTTGEMDLDSRAVVTNLRHRKSLGRCLKAVERAVEQMDSPGMQGDLLAADLRHALRALGEILGETTPDEILQSIFDHFCIGK